MNQAICPRILESLGEIIHTLSNTSQYERVFHLIVYRLTRLLGSRTCAIVLINPKTEYLTIANSYGLSHTFCNAFRKTLATGSIGNLLWTGKPIIIRDSSLEPELAGEIRLEYPFGSCIAVQIAVSHRTIGYLFIDSPSPDAFPDELMPLINACADLAASAYYSCNLAEENLRLERVDREVGVEKYSTFLERLGSALERAQAEGHKCCIMITDVDNYKNIVHTYGRDTGLQLLRELAGLVRRNVRMVHALGRYGFDEFVVLLDNADLAEAVEYGEELCKIVYDTPMTKHELRTSISVGVSCYPKNASSLDDLLIAAKHALFEAQRTGKNRTYHYTREWYAKEPEADETLVQGGGTLDKQYFTEEKDGKTSS